MGQTYYLSDLIRDYGDQGAFAQAKKLRLAGNTVFVDAESILKRVPQEPAKYLDYLQNLGYKIKVNSSTIQNLYGDQADAKIDSAMKKGWMVYSQPTPQQAQEQKAAIAQSATPMETAHLPEQERLTALGNMMESPHIRKMPPSVTGQGMRAATPEEAKQAEMPAPPTERWIQGQNILQPTESAPVRPQSEQGIPGRAAQRVLDVAMAPMGAGMKSVLMPERYWTAAKSLSNALSNSTYMALDALGVKKHQYTDWYNSQSKSFDEDLVKVLGPVEDITTVLWRNPIVALGLVGSTTRTIADMSVTPFTSEKKGAAIAGAQLKGSPLTAAIVDPVGSGFESVGNLAANGYVAVGGSPETANKIRGIGTVAVLMAFNAASAKRVQAISDKMKKGETLIPEEQQVVDQVAPNQPPENAVKILDETAKMAQSNANVLEKAKENQVARSEIQKQEVPIGQEVQGQEAVKQPWEMTREEFISNTKDQREGYSEGILSLKGLGDPGITVENRNVKVGNRIDEGVDITYRNKDGLPIAIARLSKDQNGNLAVDDFGVRKNSGLLRGRAVKAVGEEIERLGAAKPLDSISSDAARLYHHRIVQNAVSEGKPVPPEVLAEYPDLKGGQNAETVRRDQGQLTQGPPQVEQQNIENKGVHDLREAQAEGGGGYPNLRGARETPAQEITPPKEMMGTSPVGSVIQGVQQMTQPKPRPDLAQEPRSLFEDPEKYIQENRGIKIQEPSLWEKAKGPIQRLAQSFKRSRVNINPQASIPESVTQETLRRFQDARERSQVSAVDTIANYTKDLGPNRKGLLYRVIMLEDLKKDLENEKIDISEKPLGYQSEAEVDADLQNYRAQMLNDPKTADAYGRRQAVIKPILERLVEGNRLPEDVLEDPRYYHHQVLEHYTEGGRPLGTLDLRLHKKGFEMRRQGSSAAINTEGVESDFEWLSQAYFQLNTMEAQDAIRQATDITQRLKNEQTIIQDETGKKIKPSIPEGYVEWQVPPNHPFYQANTLPDRVMNEIMQEGKATIGQEDVGKALAIGKAQTWIIPENIAKELDNLTRIAPKTVPGEIARGINNAWKRWVILNPWRASKYMLNNLTGDLDAVIAIAPGTLKYAPKIAVQLWNKMWKGEATPEFQKMFEDSMAKSVLQSGLTLEEIPDVKKLPALRLLEATMNQKSPFWKRPDKMIKDTMGKYWRNVNTLNIWRESILRMSAYEYWKDKLKSGDKRYYGASDRAALDQMYDAVKEGRLTLDDVAARLARDTLGDYGNVSQAGQWMRRTTHPFWSWVEVNVPRYFHLFKNIGAESSGKDMAGAATYLGARFASKAAYNTAKVYAFSQAFYALVNLYNKTVYPNEDKLVNKDKDQLYLITPLKNDDGSRRVVRFSGALSDALDMFGMRNYIQDVQDLASGARGAKDVAWQYLSAVPENLWQRLGPAYKGLVEIGTQRQTYPRFLSETFPQSMEIKDMLAGGRPVRSGWQQAWKYTALDWVYNMYRRATGRPFPQRDAALQDLITTSVDTNQAAYYAIRNKTFDYLQEHHMEEPPPSAYKDKANAAYFFKVASQIDDKAAAKYWFKEYMNYAKEDWARNMSEGKTDKDFMEWALASLNKSVEASSPLGAIPESHRARFIASLKPDEKEMLNAAMRWYHRKLPQKMK